MSPGCPAEKADPQEFLDPLSQQQSILHAWEAMHQNMQIAHAFASRWDGGKASSQLNQLLQSTQVLSHIYCPCCILILS